MENNYPAKVKLDFMLAPEELRDKCYVPDPVRIRVIDPDGIFLTGMLGESGRKMVEAGLEFLFTRRIAEKLIANKIAVSVP